jgi:osmoprotectant transport system ATP-binding protein
LQDEFLRIQGEIKKTIVFVTHDIDEAIKMGDKIAILREGGILAQYDTPKNVLAAPNSEFVSSFVGADRVLKMLSLLRVADAELDPPSGNGDLPRLGEEMTLRDALSELIGSGVERGVVVSDTEDAVRGTLSIESIQRLSGRAEAGQRGE